MPDGSKDACPAQQDRQNEVARSPGPRGLVMISADDGRFCRSGRAIMIFLVPAQMSQASAGLFRKNFLPYCWHTTVDRASPTDGLPMESRRRNRLEGRKNSHLSFWVRDWDPTLGRDTGSPSHVTSLWGFRYLGVIHPPRDKCLGVWLTRFQNPPELLVFCFFFFIFCVTFGRVGWDPMSCQKPRVTQTSLRSGRR
ncbi:hypothetical protein LY76DRAFT_396724 [Colletotrichum caudatum]|nr:hypothetical protein LY76DRAFT_396724 [Colletotrichum caudatum]